MNTEEAFSCSRSLHLGRPRKVSAGVAPNKAARSGLSFVMSLVLSE